MVVLDISRLCYDLSCKFIYTPICFLHYTTSFPCFEHVRKIELILLYFILESTYDVSYKRSELGLP